MAAKKAGEVSLVVGSKVKAVIKAKQCLTAGDFLPALNREVKNLIEKAILRTKANRRSTVRGADL